MMIVGTWLVGMLLLVGLCLSIWIVLPAPIFALLPLSIGAPEISPGLIFANAFGLFLAWLIFWIRAAIATRFFRFTLCLSCVALVLSALPLLQFSSVQQQAERSIIASLDKNYLIDLPSVVMTRMRAKPLIISDIWNGISSPKVRIDRDILFAHPDGVPLALNIYRPTQVGTYPAIVSIYGGAWQRGSPDSDDNFNRYIAAQGYVVWAISYRHAPAYHFPTQIDDVRSALAYIKQHAIEYETNLDRVALIGRSAGAQLAMLAAYQDPPFPIKAVVNTMAL
jgi:acetyl esterase/lipase